MTEPRPVVPRRLAPEDCAYVSRALQLLQRLALRRPQVGRLHHLARLFEAAAQAGGLDVLAVPAPEACPDGLDMLAP